MWLTVVPSLTRSIYVTRPASSYQQPRDPDPNNQPSYSSFSFLFVPLLVHRNRVSGSVLWPRNLTVHINNICIRGKGGDGPARETLTRSSTLSAPFRIIVSLLLQNNHIICLVTVHKSHLGSLRGSTYAPIWWLHGTRRTWAVHASRLFLFLACPASSLPSPVEK